MEWVIAILSGAAPSILVGVVLAFWNHKQDKKHKEEEAREHAARLKDSLQISLLVTTAEMSYAQVMALKRGSPNGEVEVALAKYNKAMDKFREFEREQLWYVD